MKNNGKNYKRKGDEVTDFKMCYLVGTTVSRWIKNKPAYAIAFNQLGLEEKCFVAKKYKKLGLKNGIIMNPSYKPVDDFEEILSEEGCLIGNNLSGRSFKNLLIYLISLSFNFIKSLTSRYILLNSNLSLINSIFSLFDKTKLPERILHSSSMVLTL